MALESRATGPSPRGWGELRNRMRVNGCGRTIPTRVGRTLEIQRCRRPAPDHPHAGGENADLGKRHVPDFGPSPRGWGELGMRRRRERSWRTIPTRVGRTYVGHLGSEYQPDHPHAGGENEAGEATSVSINGPSPRGWGERFTPPEHKCAPRTIPTRVGRTNEIQSLESLSADHPHAGGENFKKYFDFSFDSGPSPRGWGERRHQLRFLPDFRTIPTRVGRTGPDHG